MRKENSTRTAGWQGARRCGQMGVGAKIRRATRDVSRCHLPRAGRHRTKRVRPNSCASAVPVVAALSPYRLRLRRSPDVFLFAGGGGGLVVWLLALRCFMLCLCCCFFSIPFSSNKKATIDHDTSTSNPLPRRPSRSPLRVRRRLQRRKAVVGRSRLLRDGPDDDDGTLPDAHRHGEGEDAGGSGLRSVRAVQGSGPGEAQGQRSDCRPGLHCGTDVARNLRHVRRHYQRIQQLHRRAEDAAEAEDDGRGADAVSGEAAEAAAGSADVVDILWV